MMESTFILILFFSIFMFLIGLFRKGAESIMFFTISAMLFIFTAVSSVSVDVVDASGIVSYGGNSVIGLLSLGFAVVAGGLAIARLEDVI